MNRNLIIVMGGGFLIAILVAFMVQAGLSGGNKKQAGLKEEPRSQILVAAKNLDVGTKLDDTNMKWQEWPQSAVFTGAIVNTGKQTPTEAVTGRLRRPLAAGEPVVKTALVQEDAGNFLAASLGEGMRAVSVNVTAVRSVAGFVSPGDYVDVILTYKENVKNIGPQIPQVNDMLELNLDRSATETIMQNVKVLAVDQNPKRDEEKAAKIAKTVTLEVDMRGAEVLSLARGMGDLTLSLRRLGDDKHYVRDYPVVTDERITSVFDELYNEMLRIQNSSGQQADIVRIYNGSSVSQLPVGQ